MTLLLILACTTQTVHPTAEKTPMNPVEMSDDGPPLDGDLQSWLESSSGLIQLPVEVRRSVLGIEGGTVVGTELELRLDDTRMGIGLADQLRSVCPDEGTCVVWLEGEYGATLPEVIDEPRPTFSVQKVISRVEGEPTNARVPITASAPAGR